MRNIEDRPLWIKITSAGIKIYYLHIPTILYRIHDNSIQVSSSKRKLFSELKLEREIYLSQFYHDMPKFERRLRLLELIRRKTIVNIGLNNRKLISRLLNKSTGYFLNRKIRKYNDKYYLRES